MSKTLVVGSCTFLYPEQGTKPGWGEEATAWAEAVTTRLSALSGPRDIDNTSVTIANAKCVATNVGSGACTLSFTTAAVRSFEVTYSVIRTDPCCVTVAEAGSLNGLWDGSSWTLTNCHIGCASIAFTITAAGQIQYLTDACAGAGTMRFRARTIDHT